MDQQNTAATRAPVTLVSVTKANWQHVIALRVADAQAENLASNLYSLAEAYVEQMDNSGVWDRPMAVAIERYREFYEAEDYHQDFMLHNPDSAYIRRWDAPKITALRVHFPDLYRARFRTG